MLQKMSEEYVQTAIRNAGAPILTFEEHPEQDAFILYCKDGWAFARTPRQLKKILRRKTKLHGRCEQQVLC